MKQYIQKYIDELPIKSGYFDTNIGFSYYDSSLKKWLKSPNSFLKVYPLYYFEEIQNHLCKCLACGYVHQSDTRILSAGNMASVKIKLCPKCKSGLFTIVKFIG